MKQQALEGTVAEQARCDNEQRAPDGCAFDQTFGPAADLLAANALVRSLRDDIESLRSECAWLRAARTAPADGCAEGKYRILFDSIDEAFCTLGDFVFDAQGRCLDYRYLEVNPAHERETGLRGVQGRTARELAAGEDRGLYDAVGRVALSGRAARFERYSPWLGGWYDLHLFRMDGAGQPQVGMLFKNINERKRAELALRQSRERKMFLLKLEDEVRALDTPAAVESAAARALRVQFGAAAVQFWEAGPDGMLAPGAVDAVASQRRPRVPAPVGALDLRMWGELHTGRSLVSENAGADPRLDGARALRLAPGGDCGWAALPMASDGHLARLLTVEFAAPHIWSEHELALAHEAAGRTWAALERARAEQSLQESEQKYRSLFDSIDEGFALVEMLFDTGGRACDFRLLEVNRAFERQTGTSNGAGKRALELIPDLEPALIERYGQVLRSGEPARFECRIAGMNNRWYSVYASRLGGPHSRQVGIVFNDITESRHAEQVLRSSERRQAFLLQLSDALRAPRTPGDAIAVAARLLGRQLGAGRVMAAEFRGQDVVVRDGYLDGLEALAGRYPRAALGAMWDRACAAWQALVIRDVEADPRLDEGERARYRRAGVAAMVGLPVGADGAAAAVFALQASAARDWSEEDVDLVREVAERTWAVVERVRAEAAVRDADRRKDEFLAVLAHELRNPLAPISNAVQMLRCASGKRKADRLMEMAHRQVRQITRLVDDLMDISRITRGKITLARQPVPLADIIASAIETSRPMIDRANHAFSLRLPSDPLVLDADKVRLTQVFSNLLNNAAKYTDPHGRITLTARIEAPLDARAGGAGGDWVAVTVRDTGIGIPPEKLGQVFDMFAQVEAAGSHSQGGLGIGLAMVRSLVQMHGGTVEAHSDGPGRGSEFTVRVPLAQPGANPGAAHEGGAGKGRSRSARLAGRRVLVVDDNRDAADSLCMLLGAHGARASCVYGGADALDMLDKLRPHSLVLDIGMPGMDGYQVARTLRADSRYAGLQVIALTGWGQEADRRRSRESGIDYHLTKPVDLAALEQLLDEAPLRQDAPG